MPYATLFKKYVSNLERVDTTSMCSLLDIPCCSTYALYSEIVRLPKLFNGLEDLGGAALGDTTLVDPTPSDDLLRLLAR